MFRSILASVANAIVWVPFNIESNINDGIKETKIHVRNIATAQLRCFYLCPHSLAKRKHVSCVHAWNGVCVCVLRGDGETLQIIV